MFLQLPLQHGFGTPEELHIPLEKNTKSTTFIEVEISGKISYAENMTWNNLYVCQGCVSFGTVRIDSWCKASEMRPLWWLLGSLLPVPRLFSLPSVSCLSEMVTSQLHFFYSSSENPSHFLKPRILCWKGYYHCVKPPFFQNQDFWHRSDVILSVTGCRRNNRFLK